MERGWTAGRSLAGEIGLDGGDRSRDLAARKPHDIAAFRSRPQFATGDGRQILAVPRRYLVVPAGCSTGCSDPTNRSSPCITRPGTRGSASPGPDRRRLVQS